MPFQVLDLNGNRKETPGTITAGAFPALTGNVTTPGGSLVTTVVGASGLFDISGASAGQIKFPATQNPSSDVNTLDDYEEGTWTPNDASGAGLTFSTAFGTYTKIGRTVHAFFVVIYPATANGAAAVMGGLPFTAIAGNSGIGGSVVMTLTSFATLILGFIGSSATTSTFRTTGNVSINNSQLSTLFVSGTCVYDSA